MLLLSLARKLKDINFELTPDQKSTKIWPEIFKHNKRWISDVLRIGYISILLGYNLKNLYCSSCKQSYYVLVIRDYLGEL